MFVSLLLVLVGSEAEAGGDSKSGKQRFFQTKADLFEAEIGL